MCDQWGPFCEAVGASERILGYLDRPTAPQLQHGRTLPTLQVRMAGWLAATQMAAWVLRRLPHEVATMHPQGHVELRGVSFNYPSRPEVTALTGIDLTIPAGTTVALVGRSGSGKSTLVSLIQRLYDPDAGSVLLDGADVRELDSAWFRRQVAVVDQNPRLFSTTIAENIAYGMHGMACVNLILWTHVVRRYWIV